MNVNLCFLSRRFFCLIIIKLFAYDRGLVWLLILLGLRRLNAVCVFLQGGGEGVTSVNAVNPRKENYIYNNHNFQRDESFKK